jgi:hypothetical protein
MQGKKLQKQLWEEYIEIKVGVIKWFKLFNHENKSFLYYYEGE